MGQSSTDEQLQSYLREHADLIAAARSIVGNVDVAEDLAQECWLRWSARSYNTERARPILFTIIKNLAFDWHRRRRVEFETLEAHRILQSTPHDSERIVSARQQLERVVRALETLPPRTLQAFRYCRVNGDTLKEAGQRLGVSESRVSQLVSDAVLRIVTALEDEGDGAG